MSTVPERVGKYKVECPVGSGGFAVVYKARDQSLNRDVAIKVLHTSRAAEPASVQRFYREAQSAANLRHPHIVTIYEIGELDDGQTYLVMEYLPGLSLDKILGGEGVLSPEQALAILEQVGKALDYAHNQGLVHRDVKPGNIMVEQKQDGSYHCVLTDFGLVKILESSDSSISGMVGTPKYMAPEQASSSRKEIGPATDLYALGVIAYRMLAGRVPFEGDGVSVLVAHVQDVPPHPSTFCSAISPEVAAVLLKALSKNPTDRYSSAEEMIVALRRAMNIMALSLMGSSGAYPQMICILAGPFWMGSDESDVEAAANEKPRHSRVLPEYHIAKYPVTNAQYRSFVQATGHPAPIHWIDGQVPSGKEDHPVVNVSHQDALAYCRWLSKVTGRHCRPPTEYEWEKAARGEKPEVRRYPWGDDWVSGRCNSAEEGWGDTVAVDRYGMCNCSPYGVADMVGNAWEWTNSLYGRYPGSGHYSASYGNAYVVRGGSWRNGKDDARISVRGRYMPDTRRPYLGFRVVWEAD